MDETERRLQIYVACLRTFQKADEEVLGYKLLRAHLPEWVHPETWIEDARPIAERLVAQERRIKTCLKHRLGPTFSRLVKPWSVSLNVLRDVMQEKPEDVVMLLENPSNLQSEWLEKPNLATHRLVVALDAVLFARFSIFCYQDVSGSSARSSA